MGWFVPTGAIPGRIALDPTPRWLGDSVGIDPPGLVQFYSPQPVALLVRLCHIRANHRIDVEDH